MTFILLSNILVPPATQTLCQDICLNKKQFLLIQPSSRGSQLKNRKVQFISKSQGCPAKQMVPHRSPSELQISFSFSSNPVPNVSLPLQTLALRFTLKTMKSSLELPLLPASWTQRWEQVVQGRATYGSKGRKCK